MPTEEVDLTLLRVTAYPPGDGPYDRWELSVEATGVVLAAGPMPFDHQIARDAANAYLRRLEDEVLARAAFQAANQYTRDEGVVGSAPWEHLPERWKGLWRVVGRAVKDAIFADKT